MSTLTCLAFWTFTITKMVICLFRIDYDVMLGPCFRIQRSLSHLYKGKLPLEPTSKGRIHTMFHRFSIVHYF